MLTNNLIMLYPNLGYINFKLSIFSQVDVILDVSTFTYLCVGAFTIMVTIVPQPLTPAV